MSDFDPVNFVLQSLPAFVVAIAAVLFVFAVKQLVEWVLYQLGLRNRLGFYIGGRWITQYVDANNKKHEETATMLQFGHRVRGTIKNKVQKDDTRKYRVQGSIRGNVLVATYEKKGWRVGIDRGAFTLQLDNTPMKMVGQFCWTDDDRMDALPTSGSYIWYRRMRLQRLWTLAKGGWARVARRGVYVGRSGISGNGVFAAKLINEDDFIAHFKGYNIPSPSPHSLFLGESHVEPIGVLRWLNHSCMPNAALKDRALHATAAIARGEEVTIDYEVTDKGRLLQTLECNCGQTLCRKKIS